MPFYYCAEWATGNGKLTMAIETRRETRPPAHQNPTTHKQDKTITKTKPDTKSMGKANQEAQ